MRLLLFITALHIFLNNCFKPSESTCTIKNLDNGVYALCNGSYNLTNAAKACNQNGYELILDLSLINSVMPNT